MFEPAERKTLTQADPLSSLDKQRSIEAPTFASADPSPEGALDQRLPATRDLSALKHWAEPELGQLVSNKKPTPEKTKDKTKEKAKPKAKAKEEKVADEEEEAPKPPEGLFPGVTDLTGDYGKLASGPRSDVTDSVILHRTHSTKASSTLSGYKQQIKKGESRGAQYLVDENGQSMLITPSDQKTTHVQGNNATAVGIEVVGGDVNLAPALKDGTLRQKVEGLNLPPAYKERLLGYDDKELNKLIKSNMHEGESSIYEDISGSQKRAVWNLTNQLADKYKLDINDLSKPGDKESGDGNYKKGHLPDFSAHEHVQDKSLGEGEAMIEFMRERGNYPKLIEQLKGKLATMQDSGASAEELARMQALLSKESGTLSALNVDGTQAEIDAVKAEKDSKKPGAATAREGQRTDFYDNFYDRIGALKKAVK